jgi:predicted RNase H-like HicB family nuclease
MLHGLVSFPAVNHVRMITHDTHNFSRVIVRHRLKMRAYCSHEYYVFGDFMVARKFTVFLEPAGEGGFIVKCGELPVATQGETREEALRNIKEAIEGYLEVKAELWGSKIKGEKAEVIVEAPSTLLA